MTGFQTLLQGQEKQIHSFFKLNACAAVVKKTTPQKANYFLRNIFIPAESCNCMKNPHGQNYLYRNEYLGTKGC